MNRYFQYKIIASAVKDILTEKRLTFKRKLVFFARNIQKYVRVFVSQPK